MTSKRTPADVLRDARRAESTRKRDLVFRAVDEMRRDGAEITYAAVARAAHVSTWLVCADGVRDYIVAARENQAADPARAKRSGRLILDLPDNVWINRPAAESEDAQDSETAAA